MLFGDPHGDFEPVIAAAERYGRQRPFRAFGMGEGSPELATRRRRDLVILFLDFDGVLHLEGEGHLLNDGTDFCFLPSLESLLRKFPHVRIVISSSWRERLAFEALIAPFAEDIRPRILGVTPPRGSDVPHSFAHREGEILAWFACPRRPRRALGRTRRRRVAVRPAQGPIGGLRILIGFDAEACAALRSHFERTRP
jgi:hypothetical protein